MKLMKNIVLVSKSQLSWKILNQFSILSVHRTKSGVWRLFWPKNDRQQHLLCCSKSNSLQPDNN